MLAFDLNRVYFKICQRVKITKYFIGTINILVALLSTVKVRHTAINVSIIVAGKKDQSIRSNLSVNLSFSCSVIFLSFILSV